MSKPVTPGELKDLKWQKKDVVIVDVRRKQDFDADTVKIRGAEWHDPEKAEEWIDLVPNDKPVVVYCVKGGAVSQSIAEMLEGRKVNARYVKGGINAWKEAGGETEEKV